MGDVRESVRIDELDKFNYTTFRNELIELYLHAFTTGDYAQRIEPDTVGVTLDGIVGDGSGCMAFVDDRVVGLVVAFPLENDPYFPRDRCLSIPVEKTIYIAEVMVHSNWRGRGIASQMLESLLQKALKEYSHAVIRVWKENKPALELYKKLGFMPVAEISQTKLNEKGEEFEMRKIYLVKEVGTGNKVLVLGC